MSPAGLDAGTTTRATGPHGDDEWVRLVPGVRRFRRPDAFLLVPADGNPLLVSRLVDEFWESLVSGTSVGDLVSSLQERHPRAGDVRPKVTHFLARLRSAGLLEGAPGPVTRQRGVRIPIDSLARPCADVLLRLPPRARLVTSACAVGMSAAGLAFLLAGPRRPRVGDVSRASLPAVFAVIAMVPIHELGHAIAARCVGVEPGPLVIAPRRWGLPRIHVSTPPASTLEAGVSRAWIAAGGPLADLLVGGAAAWWLLLRGGLGASHPAARLVAFAALVSLDVGTSPLPDGDGAHILQALLDDDVARGAAILSRSNRFVRPQSVRAYRLACAAHLFLTTWLVGRLR